MRLDTLFAIDARLSREFERTLTLLLKLQALRLRAADRREQSANL